MSIPTKLSVAGWVLLAGSLAPGCTSDRFECSEDASCVVEGIDGFCESNGYCSFPDEECSSGRRYGQMAPAEFAGVCVGASGSTGPASADSTSMSTSAPTSMSTTGAESTSSESSSSGAFEWTSSSTGETSSSTGETPPQPNVVFVASTFISTNLGAVDVAQADAQCNTLAAAEGLRGEFVAWLPDGNLTAAQRLGTARGWVRPDGMPFVDRVADLAESRIFYPPVLDEAGTEVRTRRVLTGTRVNGDAGFDCSGWQAVDDLMTVGSPGATAPSWTDDAGIACDATETLSVYCFGIDATVPVSFEPQPGRRAFTTDTPVPGDVGLDQMDALCSSNALAAGLPGSFLAVVATSTDSALSRFDTTGEPWVNMSGVPLSDTALSVEVAAHLDVSAGLTAGGDLVSGGSSYWTGASDVTEVGGETCDDWTSTTAGGRRFPLDQSTNWFQGFSTGCATPQHVLCFEE